MTSLVDGISALATRMGAESKSLRTLINGNAADLSALTTTEKSNLVLALNELKADIDAVGAQIVTIDDASLSLTKVWSSQKTSDAIAAAVQIIMGGVPAAALDTIKELADALANEETAIGALTTAIAGAVRFDQAQALTGPQKVQACTNIGVGDPTTDFVALFDAALV